MAEHVLDKYGYFRESLLNPCKTPIGRAGAGAGFAVIGIWQGVAMDYLKFHPEPVAE